MHARRARRNDDRRLTVMKDDVAASRSESTRTASAATDLDFTKDMGRPVNVRRPGDRRSLSRSATRALDVLELFGETRRPLRAVEMSKALGMHPSSMNHC